MGFTGFLSDANFLLSSKIRNKGIAAALSYMNVIEAWGSGIPRMFREAQEYGLREPELIDLGSDFRVNLYRAKSEVDQYGVVEIKKGNGVNETNPDTNGTNPGTNESNTEGSLNSMDVERVFHLIQLNSKIKQKEIMEKTGISLRTVKRIMAKLQKEGKIERKGSNRFGEWIIKK